MFRKRTVKILLAFILAVGLSFAQYMYFKNQTSPEPTVAVYAALKDISAGGFTDGLLGAKQVPRSVVTGNMLVVGRDEASGYARIDIPAGSYITKEMLSGTRVPVIEPGMRRISITVNLSSALGGRLRPGDRVDIGWVPKDSGRDSEEASMIVEGITVYEVINSRAESISQIDSNSNRFEADRLIPAVVTLVVTPDQAVKIKDYESRGSLFLLGY